MAALNANTLMDDPAAASTPRWQLWAGRILSTLAVLFLLFDAAGKLMMRSFMVDAFTKLCFPVGAVMLTGYLGGAVAIHMRAGSTHFETIFPVIFGFVIWAGIYLRDSRLRAIFPLRR